MMMIIAMITMIWRRRGRSALGCGVAHWVGLRRTGRFHPRRQARDSRQPRNCPCRSTSKCRTRRAAMPACVGRSWPRWGGRPAGLRLAEGQH